MAGAGRVRVNLSQIAPTGGHNSIVEMAAVPRVGDGIQVSEQMGCMTVHTVIWVLDEPKYDVQVGFR